MQSVFKPGYEPLFLKRDKRYAIVFNLFRYNKILSESVSRFDTYEEAKEESALLDETYSSEDRENVEWGYVIVDMENERIMKTGGAGLMQYHYYCHGLKKHDYLFRKEDDLPQNYTWSSEYEFDGWLLYRYNRSEYNRRFGDNGKPVKKKNNGKVIVNIENEIEELENSFDEMAEKEKINELENKW